LSTWVYDTPPAGEWEGLANFLKEDQTSSKEDGAWANYIMADAHEDFPKYPLEHGTPGGLPLVNFPEISMWGRSPWGGYGMNPLPRRLERLWLQTQGKLAGGMPYSEGIYEDINKAICFQLYWNPQQKVDETLKEYVAFEYSPNAVDELTQTIRLLEETWTADSSKCHDAYELACQAEKKLTPQAKQAWRWRLLFLRTLIDDERHNRQGKLEGPELKKAFDELRNIYHAEHAHPNVQPPEIP
jgi:hypothetical protein